MKYIFSKRGSGTGIYYLGSFIFSVFLNYLPDLTPYYVAAISHSNLHVIGPLTNYSEPCLESPRGKWICSAQYKIPRSSIGDAEAIGLGVVLFSLEAICETEPHKRIVISEPEKDGKVSASLRTYQTLNLDRLECNSGIILQNWASQAFYRHGYSQSPAVAGKERWVDQTKKTVEFFVVGLLAAVIFTFFIFFLVLRTLQRVTHISLESPPFDPFRFFWISFLVLTSGYLFEFFIPIELPFNFVPRITNYFGLMSLCGPTMLFVATNPRALPPIHQVAKTLTVTPSLRFWPIAFISLLVMLHPSFRYLYPRVIILIAIIGFTGAIRVRNPMMILYGICGLSDALKILMIPGLPASRLTVTYMLFIYAKSMRAQIDMLEENARVEAGTSVALQITHDIRSPLGTLKNLVPLLDGDSEVKALAQKAIQRIGDIANDFLKSSRNRSPFKGNFEQVEVRNLVSEVIREKIAEMGERKISIFSELPENEVVALINGETLFRILSNIINNSIEAIDTNEGIIKIRLSMEANWINLSVRDNGHGIPPDILNNIGRNGLTSKHQGDSLGNGIALFHAKKAIHQWGGEITFSSVQNEFTDVQIKLPLHRI